MNLLDPFLAGAERHADRFTAIETDHLAGERLAAAPDVHDVADTHARHAEPEAEPGDGEDAPRRAERGRRGKLRLQRVEWGAHAPESNRDLYFAAATRAALASLMEEAGASSSWSS